MTSVCILGAGNGGLAFAGYLASLDVDVSLYNRSNARLSALRACPQITLQGVVSCSASPGLVTSDLAEAIEGRRLLWVTIPASGHALLIKQLQPLVKPDQVVILNPGGVGGCLVHRSGSAADRIPTLAETSNLLFACRLADSRTVDISGVKESIFLHGIPDDLRPVIGSWFPQFVDSASPLETALNATNVPVHCPILATHLDDILAGRLRRFYADGIDAQSSELTERAEAEREALCRTFGVRMITLRDLYHEVSGDTLHELLRNRLGNSQIPAPDSQQHRYFCEDIPFGLVPLIDLAQLAGVPVPAMDEMMMAFQRIRDWRGMGRRIEERHLQAAHPSITNRSGP